MIGWTCDVCDQGAVADSEHEAFASARWHDVWKLHPPLTARVVTFA